LKHLKGGNPNGEKWGYLQLRKSLTTFEGEMVFYLISLKNFSNRVRGKGGKFRRADAKGPVERKTKRVLIELKEGTEQKIQLWGG